MPHQMTQNERLDYLVEAFKADSGEYRYLRTPKDTEGKRRILRSLMNIRMPGEMDESVVEIQDDYLQERIRENGIVEAALSRCIPVLIIASILLPGSSSARSATGR